MNNRDMLIIMAIALIGIGNGQALMKQRIPVGTNLFMQDNHL